MNGIHRPCPFHVPDAEIPDSAAARPLRAINGILLSLTVVNDDLFWKPHVFDSGSSGGLGSGGLDRFVLSAGGGGLGGDGLGSHRDGGYGLSAGLLGSGGLGSGGLSGGGPALGGCKDGGCGLGGFGHGGWGSGGGGGGGGGGGSGGRSVGGSSRDSGSVELVHAHAHRIEALLDALRGVVAVEKPHDWGAFPGDLIVEEQRAFSELILGNACAGNDAGIKNSKLPSRSPRLYWIVPNQCSPFKVSNIQGFTEGAVQVDRSAISVLPHLRLHVRRGDDGEKGLRAEMSCFEK